jgi:hypothetical protein
MTMAETNSRIEILKRSIPKWLTYFGWIVIVFQVLGITATSYDSNFAIYTSLLGEYAVLLNPVCFVVFTVMIWRGYRVGSCVRMIDWIQLLIFALATAGLFVLFYEAPKI